jgi:nucleoside-diphosphate-sugar epimerase
MSGHRILITGATGFVGSHTVEQARAAGHEVIATARSEVRFQELPFARDVRFVACDLHADASAVVTLATEVDCMIHLAWPDLPDYRNHCHVTRHLGADALFLRSMIEAGLKHLVGVGTCLEYGLREGELVETMRTDPSLPYPIAKDALRSLIGAMYPADAFLFRWARLFYMYGPRQNPKSLLAQLDRAMEQGDDTFPMSGGQQLRDYLPVEEVARRLVTLSTAPGPRGIFNVASGTPVTVEGLVRSHIAARCGSIEPELGVFGYPDYEPMEFWGCTAAFEALTKEMAKLS